MVGGTLPFATFFFVLTVQYAILSVVCKYTVVVVLLYDVT
jgi:hypothetical protein